MNRSKVAVLPNGRSSDQSVCARASRHSRPLKVRSSLIGSESVDHRDGRHECPLFLGIEPGDGRKEPLLLHSAPFPPSFDAVGGELEEHLSTVRRMWASRHQPFSFELGQRGAHRLRFNRLGASQIGRRHRTGLFELRQGRGLWPGQLIGIRSRTQAAQQLSDREGKFGNSRFRGYRWVSGSAHAPSMNSNRKACKPVGMAQAVEGARLSLSSQARRPNTIRKAVEVSCEMSRLRVKSDGAIRPDCERNL